MKELSIEEKAKRYDEALEKARQLCAYPTSKPFISDLQDLFPELKESEDEKIKKWLVGYFQEYKSNGIEKFANGLKIDTIIDWLEKQDNADKVKQQQSIEIPFGAKDSELQEATYYIPDGYHAEVNGNEVIIKKGEQKSVDKVEPKFKVGDWVILQIGDLVIWNAENLSPALRITNVDIDKKLYWFNDSSYLPIVDEECLHTWTIQDARDGDVLVYGDNPNLNHVEVIMLFKSVRNEQSAFTHFHTFIDQFRIDDWCDCGKSVHPATKEQRDLLFRKMKEEGYEWDADKKELIKL